MTNEELVLWAFKKASESIIERGNKNRIELKWPARDGLQGQHHYAIINNNNDKDWTPEEAKNSLMESIPKHLKLDQPIYLEVPGGGILLNPSIREVLLSHAFVFSFFNGTDYLGNSAPEQWKWHLQQMVLENDPVDYLQKFIPNPDQTTIDYGSE